MNAIVSTKNVTANLLPINILMATTTMLAICTMQSTQPGCASRCLLAMDDLDHSNTVWKRNVTFVQENISVYTTKIEKYFDDILKACETSTDCDDDWVTTLSDAILESKVELCQQSDDFIVYALNLIQKKPTDKEGDTVFENRKMCGWKYIDAMKNALVDKYETVKSFMEASFTEELNITRNGIIDFMKTTGELAIEFKKSHHEALNDYKDVILPLAKGMGKKRNFYGISEQMIASEVDLMKNTRDILRKLVTDEPNEENEKMKMAPNRHEYIVNNIEHFKRIAEHIANEIKKNENLTLKDYSARNTAKKFERITQKQLQKSCDIDLAKYQLTDIFGYHVISDNIGLHESSLRNLATMFSTADNHIEVTTTTEKETKKWRIGIQRVKKNIIMDDDEDSVPDFTEVYTYIDDKINFHVTEMGTDNTILMEHIGLLRGDYDLKKKSHAVYNFVRVLHKSMGNLLDDYCRRKVAAVERMRNLVKLTETTDQANSQANISKFQKVVKQARTLKQKNDITRSRRRSTTVLDRKEFEKMMGASNLATIGEGPEEDGDSERPDSKIID